MMGLSKEKRNNNCVVCGRETNLVATMSKSNEWLFHNRRVPLCIDCFIDVLDHKYYRAVDGESSYLRKV